MSRRRVIAVCLALLLGGVALAALLDPAARAQGWARGEPFYEGASATAWQRKLRQPDAVVATESLNTLARGKGGAVPVCAWLLRTAPEPEVRWRAADALGRMGKDARPAAKELVAALSDGDPLVRAVAVRAVGALAPDVEGGVAGLLALFPDVEAIRAAARFGPAGAAAVPSLLELLKHEDVGVRRQAVRALGKIGTPSLAALPELIRMSEAEENHLLREQSVEAIGDIGPAAAAGIPALVKALKDPVPRVRRDAVRALGQMGPVAKHTLGEVTAAVADPDPEVQAAAKRAVRLIDPTVTDKP